MSTPPVTRILLIINVLCFIPTLLGMEGFNNMMSLHFFLADGFQPYQLVTYMFMHGGFSHIFFNMLTLWIFGRVLETVWGSKKFLIYFLVCGIGAGLCQEAVQYIEYMSSGLEQLSDNMLIGIEGTQRTITKAQYLNLWSTVGASGAVYGILLAFAILFPNEKLYLYFFIPIKAKFLVIGFIAIEIFTGLANNDNVAHFAHLGGMLFGLVLVLLWRAQAKRKYSNYTSWEEYSPKQSMWDKFKGRKSDRSAEREQPDVKWQYTETKFEQAPDDPLAQRRANQAEIDRIIDKVRKSGYSSLTDKEKETIFDFRNK